MGAAVAQEKRRILVVDDVELNRLLTETILRAGTYEVDSVSDGAAALRALESARYDLVLMDIEMPGLSGHETAAAIRRTTRRPMRLAAFSSSSELTTRLRSFEVGMAAHISRPIAPHQLLCEVEQVFRKPARDAGIRPDCWQQSMYAEWKSRLGAERMRGFLDKLHDEFRNLLVLVKGHGGPDPLHRRAHDVVSTAGMMGFVEVTRACRALLEATACEDEDVARENLGDALECAIICLDRHLAADATAAAAA